ncbi:MAG: hypothetical protein K2J52_04475, partial [Duncaniella sp.]|nr:hypothetical protein [Duncaniella sp.]
MINTLKTISYLFVLLIFISCTDEIEATNPPVSTPTPTSGTLPVLYIDTENRDPIVSKEIYLNASYRLDPMCAEGVEPLGTDA